MLFSWQNRECLTLIDVSNVLGTGQPVGNLNQRTLFGVSQGKRDFQLVIGMMGWKGCKWQGRPNPPGNMQGPLCPQDIAVREAIGKRWKMTLAAPSRSDQSSSLLLRPKFPMRPSITGKRARMQLYGCLHVSYRSIICESVPLPHREGMHLSNDSNYPSSLPSLGVYS